ncbi:hypothetical protein [Ranid herpesvirus 3]|uniref:DNA (cytosine-5-)-methyltransferase n=1 Tax=Ranid herpesvirus 3 TaxID=1987509 RepID=A0A1X9T592_9VIRU|nr:hypothetical protein [Ranid herpesvirus 3]ARR28866.1 hypothetical protein [Ranid herpesvirus 3]
MLLCHDFILYQPTHDGMGVNVVSGPLLQFPLAHEDWFFGLSDIPCQPIPPDAVPFPGEFKGWYCETSGSYITRDRLFCSCTVPNTPRLNIEPFNFYLLNSRLGKGVYPSAEARHFSPCDKLHPNAWRKQFDDPHYRGSNNECNGPGFVVYALRAPVDGTFDARKVLRAEEREDCATHDVNELTLTMIDVIVEVSLVNIKLKVKDKRVNFIDEHGLPQFYCLGLPETFEPQLKSVLHPLKTLNLYCGCGSMTAGLKSTGAFDVKWAMDPWKKAAEIYKKNHQDTVTFEGDIKEVAWALRSHNVPINWPEKQEIECIVGSPPSTDVLNIVECETNETLQKDSHMYAFLNIVSYYLPKCVIIQAFDRMANVLHDGAAGSIISSLIVMGYSVIAKSVQSGMFGAPQNRTSVYFIAVDQTMRNVPDGPFPMFDFPYCEETPYFRTITVLEAIGDIARPGFSTWYARLLRRKRPTSILSLRLSALDKLRVGLIPKAPGADWRDLPNRGGCVSKNFLKQLPYRSDGYICNCHIMTIAKCPVKQSFQNGFRKSIIPWQLAHDAHVANQYSGCYGRLNWNGHFETIIDEPLPSALHGPMIHPTSDRVISVREYARAQTFSDDLEVSGSLEQMYLMIATSVPPLVALMFGYSVKRALINA